MGCALLLVSSWSLAGCHSKDASDSISTITSWSATVRLAGTAWADGEVPTPYTQRTFETAEQGLAEAAKDLGEAKDVSPAARSGMLDRLRELRQAILVARSAIQARDRHVVRPALDRIAAAEKALSALGPKGGGRQ